jgi:S-(hydroxymethyl)glutathione dehydrogenase/alcohol dehydrogenase
MKPSRSEDAGGVDQRSSVSRRRVFRQGAAIAGSVVASQLAVAQTPPVPATGSGPTGKSLAGTKFRAYVRNGATSSIEELTLRPIQPQQVVIRTQAAQACYTIVNALGPPPARPAGAPAPAAAIIGHGGVGIVEEVGSEVKRVQVGDLVVVPVTPQCGQCWMCLHGRADACRSALGRPAVPVADMRDGTPVNGRLGGFAELMVEWEEQTVPIFTKVPAVELSLLSCVMTCGLGMALRRIPVEPGEEVAVFGAGPVGLSAIQGARIAGAGQIVAVEPIRVRRELALKLGATVALDPNQYKGNDLVTKIKDICKGPTDRVFSGGRGTNPVNLGPMFVLEAVGGNRFPPKVETGPDPTGVEVLQQVWALCPPGGIIRTCGVGQPPGSTVTFPAGQWSNATKTHIPGNFAGVNTMRDLPLFVRLIENRDFDAKSIATSTFPLEKAREAMQEAADRTTIASVVTFG